MCFSKLFVLSLFKSTCVHNDYSEYFLAWETCNSVIEFYHYNIRSLKIENFKVLLPVNIDHVDSVTTISIMPTEFTKFTALICWNIFKAIYTDYYQKGTPVVTRYTCT